MKESFNILYCNTNYHFAGNWRRGDYQKLNEASDFLIDEIKKSEKIIKDKYNKNIDVIVFSEGYPQIDDCIKEKLWNYYKNNGLKDKILLKDNNRIMESLKEKYDCIPYKFSNNYIINSKEIDFPFATREVIVYDNNHYSNWSLNPIVVYINKNKYKDKYSIIKIGEDFIDIKIKDFNLIGYRTELDSETNLQNTFLELNKMYNKGMLDMFNQKIAGYNYEKTEDELLDYFSIKELIFNKNRKNKINALKFLEFLNNVDSELIDQINYNDNYEILNLIRIKNILNYIKKYNKCILIGDINMEESKLKKFNVKGFEICDDNTFKKRKLDHMYLINTTKLIFEKVSDYTNNYRYFPDHNLLFASVEV